MITSLLLIGLQTGLSLHHIILATDRDEPRLEKSVFACDSAGALEDLKAKENLDVFIGDGVAYVCRKNILRIEEAKERASLLRELASTLAKPYEATDLDKLPDSTQAAVRRLVAENPGSVGQTILQAKSAPFTVEPVLRMTLRRGEKKVEVTVPHPKRPPIDDLLKMVVQPEPRPKPRYPLNIAPAEAPPKKAFLKFQFSNDDGDVLERLVIMERFQKRIFEWAKDVEAEFESCSAEMERSILRAYPDMDFPSGTKSLADLPAAMQKEIEQYLTRGYLSNFSSAAEAQSFFRGCAIESIDLEPSIAFRIKEDYSDSGDGLTRSLALRVPRYLLVSPIGK